MAQQQTKNMSQIFSFTASNKSQITVIYSVDKQVSVNNLCEIRDPELVNELHIDGMVIDNNDIFRTFKNLKIVRGVPEIKTTDLSCLFKYCEGLVSIGDLGKWDMSEVTTTYGMFCRCRKLRDVGDLTNLNTEKVLDRRLMFSKYSIVQPSINWVTPDLPMGGLEVLGEVDLGDADDIYRDVVIPPVIKWEMPAYLLPVEW